MRLLLTKAQCNIAIERGMAKNDGNGFGDRVARVWQEIDKKLENAKRFGDPVGDALRRMGEKGVVLQLSTNPRNAHRDSAKNIFEWVLSFHSKLFLPRSRLNCDPTKDEVIISSSLSNLSTGGA
jgi:hypothetical protein